MDIVELVMRVVVVAALVTPLVVMALRRPPVGGRFPAGTDDGWSLPSAGRGDPRRQADLVGARGPRR